MLIFLVLVALLFLCAYLSKTTYYTTPAFQGFPDENTVHRVKHEVTKVVVVFGVPLITRKVLAELKLMNLNNCPYDGAIAALGDNWVWIVDREITLS